jgi:hypothetical protein
MMESKQLVWDKKKLENYFDNYILYLTHRGIITKKTARNIKRRKKDIIGNILKRNIPWKNYPFVLVFEPRLYCLIDVDTGYDLMEKTANEAAEIIKYRERHQITQEHIWAMEEAYSLRLILSEKRRSPATTLAMQIQWRSKGSYAEIIELN